MWIADATVGDPPPNRLMPRLESALRAGRGHQVMKLTPDGKIAMALGTKGVPGTDSKTFNAPTAVAVAPNGDIFVTDGHDAQRNARVVKFSKDGKLTKAWGKLGSNPGEFNTPHALAIDSQGRILVADRGNQRIQVFNPAGQFITQWTQFGRPSGIAVAPDDTMFVTTGKQVTVGSARDGSLLGTIDAEGEGISADGRGNVLVQDAINRTVKKFSRTDMKGKTSGP